MVSEEKLGRQSKLEEVRQAYLIYRTKRYLMEHPNALESKARKYAKVSWKRKLEKLQKRGIV